MPTLYQKVTKRCSAVRLSRDEAKASLLRQFTDAEVLDLRRRGDKWVATLLTPKTAEFPPSPDEDDDSEEKAPPKSADDEGPSDSESSDDSPFGPPSEDEGGPPKGPGEGKGEKPEIAAIHELTSLVHAIADKLGIVPMGGEAPGGLDGGPVPPPPDMPPPGGGPPGPGGPGGGPQEILHRTKLKPGEAPPGTTPIGSPAFSHQLARMQSFDAFDDTEGKTIKAAKEELEALYGPHGFRVRQIKRVENGQRLAAKLSRR